MISSPRAVKCFFFGLLIFLLLVQSGEARTAAFFFALDADWKSFREAAQAEPRAREMGGRIVFELKIGDTVVYAVKMEAGCVQTAISAQALLANRKVDLAISVGPVGALDDRMPPGSWIIVDSVVPWQKTELSKLSSGSAYKIGPPPFEPLPAPLIGYPHASVASGEQFIASASQRTEIALATDCHAVDMNLFGLASVLEIHKTPSIHLRIVSDHANESAGQDFAKFAGSYDGSGGCMAAQAIAALPPDMTSPKQYPNLNRLLNNAKP